MTWNNSPTFHRATPNHENLIFQWLAETHMREFWDNSEEHYADIRNFLHGRPQTYFAGTTQYWIGCLDDQPYALVLSDVIQPTESDLPEIWRNHMSDKGTTLALDFGIGDPHMIGKGLAAPTLVAFMNFYHTEVDPKADAFLMDPDPKNPRANHVYEKAGFKFVGQFQAQGGAFDQKTNNLMVFKL